MEDKTIAIGAGDQQRTVLPFGNGLDGFVNGVHLVITWGLATTIFVVVLGDGRQLLWLVALPLLIFRPQFIMGRELIKAELLFYRWK